MAGDAEWRLISQTDLVQGYLDGRRPNLAEPHKTHQFEHEKWLSLIISDDTALLRDCGRFEQPPHGEGPLRLNPIYRATSSTGKVSLAFEFPSTWYAFENAQALSYHTTGIKLTAEDFEAARSGQRTAQIDDLVRQYVLLGVPERYTRPPVPEPA